MSNSFSRGLQKAKETSKANLKIGFLGNTRLHLGIVGRFLPAAQKPQAFVAYSDVSEEVTRAKAIELAKQVSGEDHSDFMPCLWIEVIKDTSMTPTSRYNGSFIDLSEANQRIPRSLKRHGDFITAHMSPEIPEHADKSMWLHIQWVRLTPDYGGDLTLFGDDANDELSMLLTRLPNKKDAAALVQGLREGDVTLDALAMDRGYDPVGVRETLRQNAGKAKDQANASDAGNTPAITEIGAQTKKAFGSLKVFTEKETVKFLVDKYNEVGSIDALSEISKAGTGDLALLVGDKEYFRGLMEATALDEKDALAQVIKDTDVGNGADVAALLGITEASF